MFIYLLWYTPVYTPVDGVLSGSGMMMVSSGNGDEVLTPEPDRTLSTGVSRKATHTE